MSSVAVAPDSPEEAAEGTSRKGAGRLPVAALVVACLSTFLYFGAELYMLDGGLAFPLDDSWIHLRFAEQMAAGNGLSYDGERWMPGSTAPLWTALLSLGFVAGAGPMPLLWAKVLGVLCWLWAIVACDRLAGELGLGPGARRLATVAAAASHWMVWASLSGMEIPLFTALALSGLVLDQRERRQSARGPWSVVVFATAALARPEGYLLLALAVGSRFLRFSSDDKGLSSDGLQVGLRGPGRDGVVALVAAAMVVVPSLLFYRVAGGSFLPTTFAVKAGSPWPSLIPSGQYLRAVFDVVFRSQPWLVLFAVAGALKLVRRLGSSNEPSLLLVAWPVGQALVYALLADPGGPVIVGNFGRYYFPLLPVIAVLGVVGIEDLGRWLGPRTRLFGWRAPLRALLVALILAPQLLGLLVGPGRYTQTLTNVEDSDVRAAHWLGRHLHPEAVLAVQDIGALQYFLPNPIIDLAGIVEPEILPALRGEGSYDRAVYWEDRLVAYLSEQRPDYLVVFPRSYPRIANHHPGFRTVRRFPITDNVTMAGPELVVLATPWTRHPLPEGDGG